MFVDGLYPVLHRSTVASANIRTIPTICEFTFFVHQFVDMIGSTQEVVVDESLLLLWSSTVADQFRWGIAFDVDEASRKPTHVKK